MDIWRIVGGKRSGPYPDYEIRGMIENGGINAEERLWHEGLDEWVRADQVGIFKGVFEKRVIGVTPPPLPKEVEDGKAKASLQKPTAFLLRRFFARWMDLFVYAALWWLALYFSGRNIGAAWMNPWLKLIMYIPWFAVEAWMLHRFGSTPGKWLMGLSVRNTDDSLLTLKASIWRSLRVLVTGIGFGWMWLSPLCQLMSWFTARRIGKPVWDYLGGHKVVATELNPFKLMAVIFSIFVAVMLQFAVTGPYQEEVAVKQNPKMEESYELLRHFYLPRR